MSLSPVQKAAFNAVNQCVKGQGLNIHVPDNVVDILTKLPQKELVEMVIHYAYWLNVTGKLAARQISADKLMRYMESVGPNL